MSAKDGGRPAFPTTHSWSNTTGRFEPAMFSGMTLRDYFAGQALIGYAANARVMNNAIDEWEDNGGPRPICIAEYLAGLAYEVADAMLAARATTDTGEEE